MWRGGGCRHMVRVRIRWGGGAAMDTTHVHGTIHGNAGAMWSRTRSGTGRATGHGRRNLSQRDQAPAVNAAVEPRATEDQAKIAV